MIKKARNSLKRKKARKSRKARKRRLGWCQQSKVLLHEFWRSRCLWSVVITDGGALSAGCDREIDKYIVLGIHSPYDSSYELGWPFTLQVGCGAELRK